jgi:hypothetical protein
MLHSPLFNSCPVGQLPFAAELKLYNPGSTFHRPRPPSRVASQQLLQPPFHNPSTATDYYKLQSPFSQLFYNTIPYRPNKQLFYTLFMADLLID